MSQYGGVGMDDVRKWMRMPMITVIRLLGAMKRRLNPQSAPPGADVDENQDAAIIAMLNKKVEEAKRRNQ